MQAEKIRGMLFFRRPHRERSLFIGNFVGKYNDLVELMTLKAQGSVTLHTTPYPLDAANDAIHALDSGQLRGRAILIP